MAAPEPVQIWTMIKY